MKRIVTLLIALLMLASPSLAEEAVYATVNGESLLYSNYAAIESAYLYQYEMGGADLGDPSVYAYLTDLATTYAIEQILVRQDMAAQGCLAFDEETEAWFLEQGKAAYAQAIADVKASLRTPETSEDEVEVMALAYAKSLNVTEQTYVDFYRDQYAYARYYEWLTKDQPVTDAQVQAAYEARVEQSRTLYAQDAAAFETAMNNGQEVWYRPEGYRTVLQILLPAQGASDEEKLQSVQEALDVIQARLSQGEAFASLIPEFSVDVNLTGYQVHQDSVIWDDAFIAAVFSPEMAQPCSWSQPLVSDLGVHILYYLEDTPAGAMPLTDEIAQALHYHLYTERYTAALAERLDVLAAEAEVIFH